MPVSAAWGGVPTCHPTPASKSPTERTRTVKFTAAAVRDAPLVMHSPARSEKGNGKRGRPSSTSFRSPRLLNVPRRSGGTRLDWASVRECHMRGSSPPYS